MSRSVTLGSVDDVWVEVTNTKGPILGDMTLWNITQIAHTPYLALPVAGDWVTPYVVEYDADQANVMRAAILLNPVASTLVGEREKRSLYVRLVRSPKNIILPCGSFDIVT